jgi:hypothetical protein
MLQESPPAGTGNSFLLRATTATDVAALSDVMLLLLDEFSRSVAGTAATRPCCW